MACGTNWDAAWVPCALETFLIGARAIVMETVIYDNAKYSRT
jgi:hypothetical protein